MQLSKSSSQTSTSALTATWIAFKAMAHKELIIMTRYPVNFVASFFQIFFIIAVFTLAGLTFSGGASGGESTVSIMMASGFVLFIFVSDTLWTIGFNVRREQIEGTLEQLYLSPANKFANLVSRVITLITWTGLLCVVAVIVMDRWLGRLPFNNPGLAIYIFLMTLAGTFGMGFAYAALTLRIKETANTLTNLLQFVFMIGCAMFFPFSALPDFVLWFSRLIPTSYSVDAFRSTLMDYPSGYPELAPIETEIAIITVFGLVMPIIGYFLYRKAEDVVRMKGSLAEY